VLLLGGEAVETWEFKDLSCVGSAAIAAALDYWRSKSVAPSIPSRSQIDPLEMRSFLSKLLMIDVESDREFAYRLCGTRVAAINGKDLTGQRASEVNLGASSQQFIEVYQRVIRSKEPILFTGRLWWQDREWVGFEQIILPLSTDGRAVDKLMCVIDCNLPGEA
jgi:hypothetical protein